MHNLFVYLEIEEGVVADVSLELLTKGRSLANQLGCRLEAIAAGAKLDGVEEQVFPYGVDVLHMFRDERLSPYTTLPHTSIVVELFKKEKPTICLMGANHRGGATWVPVYRLPWAAGSRPTARRWRLANHEENPDG